MIFQATAIVAATVFLILIFLILLSSFFIEKLSLKNAVFLCLLIGTFAISFYIITNIVFILGLPLLCCSIFGFYKFIRNFSQNKGKNRV